MRATTKLVIVTMAIAVTTSPAFAQHLGARQQWQYQVTAKGGYDPDPRLEQMVKLDILGRPAVSTLAILSEQTGISFKVAPEDLATVGERKLSLFAFRPVRLKDVIVQIPEALQEAHWDIDTSGKGSVYLLHRNSGVYQLPEPAARGDGLQPMRQARLEALRRGLAMTPEELKQLEGSDWFLARNLQDARLRPQIEAFLSLPSEKLEEFLRAGQVSVPYPQAPPLIQQVARSLSQGGGRRPPAGSDKSPAAPGGGPVSPIYDLDVIAGANPEALTDCLIEYRDGFPDRINCELHVRSGSGPAVFRSLLLFTPGVPDPDLNPPDVYAQMNEEAGAYLLETGTPDRATAAKIIADRNQKMHEAVRRDRERALRQMEASAPDDPDLRHPVPALQPSTTGLGAWEQRVARDTGLSVVSDYFSVAAVRQWSSGAKSPPLWEVLVHLNKYGVLWQKRGRVLVLHHPDWQRLTRTEVPESLILTYRQKLEKQGQFTLDDAAAFALAIDAQEFAAQEPVRIPEDLRQAGLGHPEPGLMLYASLTPEQRTQARSQTGLPVAPLTDDQRRHVLKRWPMPGYRYPRLTDKDARQARFRVRSLGTPENGITEQLFFRREGVPEWPPVGSWDSVTLRAAPLAFPATPGAAGTWIGAIQTADGEVQIAFRVVPRPDNSLVATFDGPDHDIFGQPVRAFEIRNGRLRIDMGKGDTLEGKVTPDGTKARGSVRRAGQSLPFTLERIDKAPEPKRSPRAASIPSGTVGGNR